MGSVRGCRPRSRYFGGQRMEIECLSEPNPRLDDAFQRQEELRASVSETSRVLGTSGMSRQTHRLMAITGASGSKSAVF
jgi:hypothetical protein